MKHSTVSIPRNFVELVEPTGNIYETAVVIAKNAKRIVVKVKNELDTKFAEFTSQVDNSEEVSENKEHIEISKFYEKQPKPAIISTEEFLAGKIIYHYPDEASMPEE
jgi:DNA-directed RNA polymerase subunit K/omega